MSDEFETYLRRELGRTAQRAPKAPPRFPAEVVALSNRRRTARTALMTGVCVTAIALPAGLITTGGGDVVTGTISTTATPSVPPRNHTGDEYRIGEVVEIDNPSQKRPIHLWYARTDDGTVLCERVIDRTGFRTERCGGPLGDEEATQQGSTETFPAPATGQVMYFGTARDKVARVTALTGEGKVTGTLHRPEGAPQGIWTVTVPSDKTVTVFEFAGPGGETVTRIEPQRRGAYPEAQAKPVGPTLDMPGKLVVGLYETPGKTLIWKRNGQAVGRTHAITSGGPLTDLGGKPMNVELRDHKEHWFGITGTETARVELVFKDGTTVKAETRRNPWKIDGFRLFAGTQRHSEDLYRDGFRIVGYDADGAELWHEDHG